MSEFGDEYGWSTLRGVRVLKRRAALQAEQNVIEATRPDVVVETGTKFGGSANFYADLGVDVISVDVACPKPPLPHPRVTYLTGYSTDPRILFFVEQATAGRRTMVVLDSDHSMENVRAELEVYAGYVTTGCYLIVEDLDQGGPQEALDGWLPAHPEFQFEPCELVPEHGFLRRWN